MAHKVGLSGWVWLGGAQCVQINPSEVTLHVGPLEVPFSALISLAKGRGETVAVDPVPFSFPRVSFCELLSYVEAVLDALHDGPGVGEVRKTLDLLTQTIKKSDLLSSLAEHVALSGTLLFGLKAGKPSIAMSEYTLHVGPLMLSAADHDGLMCKGSDEPSAALEAAPAAATGEARGARGSGGARAPESVTSSQPVSKAPSSLSTWSLTMPRTSFAELLDFVGSTFGNTALATNLDELAAKFGPGGKAPHVMKSALALLGVSGEFCIEKVENKKLSLVPRELCVHFGPLKLDLAALENSTGIDGVTVDLPPTSFAELVGFIASVGGSSADDEAGQESHPASTDTDDASAVLRRVREKLFDPESPLAAFVSVIASVKVSGKIKLQGRKLSLLECTVHCGAFSLKLNHLSGDGTLEVVLAPSSPNELLEGVGPLANAIECAGVTEKLEIAQKHELMKSFWNELRISGTLEYPYKPETSSIAVRWGPCTIVAESGSTGFELYGTLGEVLDFAFKVDRGGGLGNQITKLRMQLAKGDASFLAAMLLRVTVTGRLRFATGKAPEFVGLSLEAKEMTEESERRVASLQSLSRVSMLDADDEKRLKAYNAIEAVIGSLKNVHEQVPTFRDKLTNEMQPKLNLVSKSLSMPKTAWNALKAVGLTINTVKLACKLLSKAPAPVGPLVTTFSRVLVMLDKSVKTMQRVLKKLQASTSKASKPVNKVQKKFKKMTDHVNLFHVKTGEILVFITKLKSFGIYLPVAASEALVTANDDCKYLKEQIKVGINNVKEAVQTIKDVGERFEVVKPIEKLVVDVKHTLDPLNGPLAKVSEAWKWAKSSNGIVGWLTWSFEQIGNVIESALESILEVTGLNQLLDKANGALNPLCSQLKPLQDKLSGLMESLTAMTKQFDTLATFKMPNLDAITEKVREPLDALHSRLHSFTDNLGHDAVGKLQELLQMVLAPNPQAIPMVVKGDGGGGGGEGGGGGGEGDGGGLKANQLPQENKGLLPKKGDRPLKAWRDLLLMLLQHGVRPTTAMGNAAEMLADERVPTADDPSTADNVFTANAGGGEESDGEKLVASHSARLTRLTLTQTPTLTPTLTLTLTTS